MNTSTAYAGQPSHGSGASAAYTSQATGNVMATGTPANSVGSYYSSNYGGQTVQIGNERYIIANQAQHGQYDRLYASGMSG